jgi:hypothetical protein
MHIYIYIYIYMSYHVKSACLLGVCVLIDHGLLHLPHLAFQVRINILRNTLTATLKKPSICIIVSASKVCVKAYAR